MLGPVGHYNVPDEQQMMAIAPIVLVEHPATIVLVKHPATVLSTSINY